MVETAEARLRHDPRVARAPMAGERGREALPALRQAPGGARVVGDTEVHEPPAAHLEGHEDVQSPAGRGHRHTEVAGHEGRGVLPDDGGPPLIRRPARSPASPAGQGPAEGARRAAPRPPSDGCGPSRCSGAGGASGGAAAPDGTASASGDGTPPGASGGGSRAGRSPGPRARRSPGPAAPARAARAPTCGGAAPVAPGTRPAASGGNGSPPRGRSGTGDWPPGTHEIDPARGPYAANANERLDRPQDGADSPASSWYARHSMRFSRQTGEVISTE